MIEPKAYKNLLLAELVFKLKNHKLAFHLFSKLEKDKAVQKNPYLHSSVLFGLGLCHVIFEHYDTAYVQFMKANTVWPNSPWAQFAIDNASTCIEELGGETLALEQFQKNKKTCKSTDNFLSLAYHAYHLNTVREKALDKELKLAKSIMETSSKQEDECTKDAHENSIDTALKISYSHLNHAFTLNPNDTIVLKFIVILHEALDERGVKRWSRNEDALFKLADYYRNENLPHEAQKIYHDWFEAIEKKRLAEGREVSMLCLLGLEAECYEEMGCLKEAIDVLQRQNQLFRSPSESRTKHIQEKKVELAAFMESSKSSALNAKNNKGQASKNDSIAYWKANPMIQPGFSHSCFFEQPKKSHRNKSATLHRSNTSASYQNTGSLPPSNKKSYLAAAKMPH